jgi:hypothetical protein
MRSAHAFGDERPFVLGHRAPNLQQELVMRILAQGPVEELDAAAGTLELFEEHHLVDGVARQPIRRGEHDEVTARGSRRIPQGI